MFKSWYKSKTIIGALIAIAAMGLESSGLSFGPEARDAITGNVLKLIEIVGALFAIYGRVKADGKIGK